jgi:hypothetical protein
MIRLLRARGYLGVACVSQGDHIWVGLQVADPTQVKSGQAIALFDPVTETYYPVRLPTDLNEFDSRVLLERVDGLTVQSAA